MKLNSNAFHNALNVAIIAVPALEVFDWTPFFPPETALKIVGALGLLKICINIYRDGANGLTSPQPPVQK